MGEMMNEFRGDNPAKGYARAWLEEQKTTWECPDCQSNFSWYQRECALSVEKI
jgi:hypothetical protein